MKISFFDEQGIEAFRKYQLELEDILLEPSTAFYLVQSLLELNTIANKPIVEVVVMSRNSPETGMRILNSIKEYGLDITRVALTGGEPLAPYIDPYAIDLFLSKDAKDLQAAIDCKKCAASLLYSHPTTFVPKDARVKIAFDADAVLFSDESELRYKTEGVATFQDYVKAHEDDPLNKGSFAKLLMKLS